MSNSIDDIRILAAQPLITHWVLAEELLQSVRARHVVATARRNVENVMLQRDLRLLLDQPAAAVRRVRLA